MTNWINKLGLFVFRGNDSFPGLPSSQTKVFNSQVSSNRVMMEGIDVNHTGVIDDGVPIPLNNLILWCKVRFSLSSR